MNMVYVMIPLALVLLVFAVAAFIWASRSGQFDDLDSPGWSVILDDDKAPPPDIGEPGEDSDEEESR